MLSGGLVNNAAPEGVNDVNYIVKNAHKTVRSIKEVSLSEYCDTSNI